MTQTDKLITKAINGLDWKTIVSLHIASKNILFSKDEMMKELKEKILFMIEGNVRQLKTKYWIINYRVSTDKDRKMNKQLEVFYIASGMTCEMNNDITEIKEHNLDMSTELRALNGMMERALAKEEYELCAIIRRRIKAIVDKR